MNELAIDPAFVVTTPRWASLDLPAAGVFDGVRRHVPQDSVAAAAEHAAGHDGLLAVGGGSAIDTAKAVSARTGLRVVSVPTTYSGAEWTTGFGVRDEARGVKEGGGGSRPVGIVYEPDLTLTLLRDETGGTALNALAHCAEALYVKGRNTDADAHALMGARVIAGALPRVLEDGADRAARRDLLEGAIRGRGTRGCRARARHAMAQALGGRYGIAHGALNAVCLPAALRFNEPVAFGPIARLGAGDAAERIEELAGLAGFSRLRELGVPGDELDLVAEETVERAGARMNPRRPTASEVAELLRSVW